MTELATTDTTAGLLVPADAGKDARHRLGKYAGWLDDTGRPWYKPDLREYRNALAARYAPASVRSHLSTVRGRYAELTRDRDRFYRIAEPQTDDPILRKMIVDEMIQRVKDAMHPDAAKVKVVTVQDEADSDNLRLTPAQTMALLAAPGVDTLLGLRDTAILALLVCTGIREMELVSLDVDDLRQHLAGELALRVREGKGCKTRLIPYGDLAWVLVIVDKWLASVGIERGAVFAGFYKGGQRLRPHRLRARQVQNICGKYPVVVDDGILRTVRPHDLRRTYAKLFYDSGGDLLALSENLGHKNLATTKLYIGPQNAARRRPGALFSFDLGRLADVPVQAVIKSP